MARDDYFPSSVLNTYHRSGERPPPPLRYTRLAGTFKQYFNGSPKFFSPGRMNQTWSPLIIHRLNSRSGFTVTMISSSITSPVQLLAGSTRHRCGPVAVASFLSLFLQLAQIIASLDPDSLKER